MSAMRRVGFVAAAFLLLSIGVSAVSSQLIIERADADKAQPPTPPPDPVVIHEGEEVTWHGVVCDVWSCGCRLRQMVRGRDGKSRAIAPAVVFANEKDREKAMQAWGQELEVRGIAKGGTIIVAKVTGPREGHVAD